MYALYYAYMPRIAKPASLQTESLRRALKIYLAQELLSVNEISKRVSVEQSTLCRFVSGRTKSVTPAINKVLSYAQIDINKCITEAPTLLDNSRIRSALAKVWDGTPETAEVLAGLIEIVGPLVTRHIRAPR
jgi:hypothetical protein